jgi:hypothetical protein
MNPDAFIGTAIEVASRNGIGALDANQRLVYLISEAEVLCDMEGIDAFLGRYFPNGWKRPRPPSLRSEPLGSLSPCVQLPPTR